MIAEVSQTRRLVREALEAVRTAHVPLDDAPAFVLEHSAPHVPRLVTGSVRGLPGDLWETASAIRDGRFTARAVLEESLSAIQEHDSRLHAFEHTASAEALFAALPSPGDTRPLAGIPLSIKDVIDVEGMPTSGSSRAFPARLARHDAEAVGRLRAAGALILGKAVTHEFALGVTTPQSRNPWDESRIAGGSSGGSVISLVTRMALGSLGTDTRASIRVPAALSGAVGFKPSLGVVPIDSWCTLSWTMDHFAPMARSVRDIAILLNVLTESRRFTSALPGSMNRLRIRVPDATMAGLEPGVLASMENAIAACERAGARVQREAHPTAGDFALANAVGTVISRVEALQFHREAGTDLGLCTPEVRDQLEEAAAIDGASFVRAFRLRRLLRTQLLAAFADADLLLMPTTKVVAPPREKAGNYLFLLSENCIPWSLVDFPAVSLFSGMAERLPTGVQLVARPGCDEFLLSAAYAFEREAPDIPNWSRP